MSVDRVKIRNRSGWYYIQLAIFGLLILTVLFLLPFPAVKMPGRSFTAKLPALSPEELELSRNLKKHVIKLASDIGDRNYLKPIALKEAADYIRKEASEIGLSAKSQYFRYDDRLFENIEFELPGSSDSDEIILLGAHYDSCDCPGANDNGSGVAALLELARILKDKPLRKTVKFVAFTNEEHYFGSNGMGSYYYAKRCRQRKENISVMLALETIGYYSDENGSQKFPFGLKYFYPDRGNFIAFVSDTDSKAMLKKVVKTFRQSAKFPSQGLAAPRWIKGVSWSDHEQFWKQGYKALMVTDTAPFRYPHYHKASDTPDKIDYDKTAMVVFGLSKVVLRI